MNTLIFVGLFMYALVAYTSALPYPSEVVPETPQKTDTLVAVDTGLEGESLVPAESAWGGYGGGYGGGWGHGGGRGWGHGGGWGHHGGHHGGHYGGHYGGHHGHHHWGR